MKTQPIRFIFALAAAVALVVAAPAARADFEAGMNYFKSAKYLEAAAEFQAIVDENPDYADGYNLLGACFLKSNKPEEAEKSFLKALELAPDNFNYHFNLANAYLAQKNYRKVVGALNNAEQHGTEQLNQRIYGMRGSALAVQKKWAESIEDLEKAVRIKPDNLQLTYLGKAYFTVGQNDNAVATLKRALKDDPSNAGNYELLAEGLLNMAAKATSESSKKQYYSDAQDAARAYAKLKPGTDGDYMIGRAALGAGDYDSAISAFNKVVAKKGNHCNARANLGKAYIAKKQWQQAIDAMSEATGCDPNLSVAWEGKGFAYQMKASAARDGGNPQGALSIYDEAISAYEKGMSIKPSSASEKAVTVCRENKQRIHDNMAMDDVEAANAAAIKAEEERLRLEQEKRDKWKEKRDN